MVKWGRGWYIGFDDDGDERWWLNKNKTNLCVVSVCLFGLVWCGRRNIRQLILMLWENINKRTFEWGAKLFNQMSSSQVDRILNEIKVDLRYTTMRSIYGETKLSNWFQIETIVKESIKWWEIIHSPSIGLLEIWESLIVLNFKKKEKGSLRRLFLTVFPFPFFDIFQINLKR